MYPLLFVLDVVNITQIATNNTNITSLDDFPEGVLTGEPIIGLLEPKDMFEEGKRGIVEDADTEYFSTMVEVHTVGLKYVYTPIK